MFLLESTSFATSSALANNRSLFLSLSHTHTIIAPLSDLALGSGQELLSSLFLSLSHTHNYALATRWRALSLSLSHTHTLYHRAALRPHGPLPLAAVGNSLVVHPTEAFSKGS